MNEIVFAVLISPIHCSVRSKTKIFGNMLLFIHRYLDNERIIKKQLKLFSGMFINFFIRSYVNVLFFNQESTMLYNLFKLINNS